MAAWLFPDLRVLIRGAGDLASGVAYRLVQAGLPVIMLERPQPLFVRRTVSFGNAIFEGGQYQVEGLTAIHIPHPDASDTVLAQGYIPILIDPDGHSMAALQPTVLVDARLQKDRLDTRIEQAPCVIALGPGFTAGQDCHAIIETQRGHTLGRVIRAGSALPDTGTPGQVQGYAAERVLRTPADGYVLPADDMAIGSHVEAGTVIATISGQVIQAAFPGVLRGLVHPSVPVWAGLKIGDIDPRGDVSHCYTISDKALAIGGGVLEAILSDPSVRTLLAKAADHAPL